MTLNIIKDIEICYDGIHLIKLSKGETFDIKGLLPNAKKAAKFEARLTDLGVAEAVEAVEAAEVEAAEVEAVEVEAVVEKPKRGRKKKEEVADAAVEVVEAVVEVEA